MPDFFYENGMNGVIAGIDEAGRGPWAGPVVAAAVVLDRNHIPEGIDDSKKLTHAQREILFETILNHSHVGIGSASVEEIDQHNILQATFMAMRRAYEQLTLKITIDGVLVDGNQVFALPCPLKTLVKGDSLSLTIAAASIVAKVTRDRLMNELAQACPHYAWERNAGYGTKAHQEGIARYGITEHHRRSFAPIRNYLSEHS
ncbi:MAG: ribonuclease HII [Alphaproteobacteria bacterium]|nr:ribonuclease HII [Alphaproteobacteria bacterium]